MGDPFITLEQYLMGRDKIAPLNVEMKADALITVQRVNKLLLKFGRSCPITSGYRPEILNKKIPNSAEHSNHIVCRAADLRDRKGDLDRYCVQNQDFLEEIGLWLESPTDTPGWCHVQIVPPKSGHRIFIAK